MDCSAEESLHGTIGKLRRAREGMNDWLTGEAGPGSRHQCPEPRSLASCARQALSFSLWTACVRATLLLHFLFHTCSYTRRAVCVYVCVCWTTFSVLLHSFGHILASCTTRRDSDRCPSRNQHTCICRQHSAAAAPPPPPPPPLVGPHHMLATPSLA